MENDKPYTLYMSYDLPLDNFVIRPLQLEVHTVTKLQLLWLCGKVDKLVLDDCLYSDWGHYLEDFLPNYLRENPAPGADINSGCPFNDFAKVDEFDDFDTDAIVAAPTSRSGAVDTFNLVCVLGSYASHLIRAMLYTAGSLKHENNYLDSHPDGLAKHIGVYKADTIPVDALTNLIENSIVMDEIPFFIEAAGTKWYVLFGTDITNGTCRQPTVDYMSERLNGDLHFYLEQVLNHFNWKKEAVTISLIGYKDFGNV